MGETDSASTSELFEILSHRHRRQILWVLANPGICADTAVDTGQFTGPGGEPDVLRLELIHNHFPKLDDHGLVDWDAEAETLTRGPRFDGVEPFIELMNEHQDGIPQNWP